MANVLELICAVRNGIYDETFKRVYKSGKDGIEGVRARYIRNAQAFIELFGDMPGAVFVSAPGRTEICGNHTDHNLGRVAAASVSLDVIAVAAPSNDDEIKVKSEGYDTDEVSLSDLTPQQNEREHSASLVRGVAAAFRTNGLNIKGYRAHTTSNVLKGSGLSSSAAFETLIGTIQSVLFNGSSVSPVDIGIFGQYAENEFFGKPCGLMDQLASSVGSFITIDFEEPKNPRIERLSLDLEQHGLDLIIVDTGGNHSDLTEDYASIPREMRSVAAYFEKDVLRQVDEKTFYAAIQPLREALQNDRAVLRAHHYFGENRRVLELTEAVKTGDMKSFLSVIREGGLSSYNYNQNIYSPMNPREQNVAVALAMSQRLLGESGAYRIQGGGFAGTMQAFVPKSLTGSYVSGMESVFGKGSCHRVTIRDCGGVQIKPQ